MRDQNEDEEVVREIRSSAQMLKEFKDNLVWLDIVSELKDWLDGLHEKLEQEDDHVEIYRHQGRAELLKKVLQLPSILYESAVIAAEDKVREREESGD